MPVRPAHNTPMNKRADWSAGLEQSAFWMPYTANRQFKKSPRLLARAEGMRYWTVDGRELLDGTAGLWCVNAGHCRPKIVEAVRRQVGEMDFAPTFQMGHPIAFEFADRLARVAPTGFSKVFFTNSGSESVDTALKIALAYHRVRGEGQRFRLIGRERGYHGVNFGGMAVGGILPNRKMFGPGVAGVDHIRHTHDPARNAFSCGQPEHGVEFADDLERVCALHDPSTIAAVIVEPVAGSAGVLVPPRGYLERLREICTKHGILLIFDEVITGFGRLGQPFGSQYFNVMPDLFTAAKGLTNGTVPMGAVFARDSIYEAFMQGPEGIELFHGYTYSGHPLACAAGIATLDTYAEEGLLTRGASLETYWADAAQALKGTRHVVDIRNCGLIAGIELEPRPGAPGKRAYEAFLKAFEAGVLIRVTGDIIALSPPLIIEKPQIDRLFSTVREALQQVE
jgi:beta-alanine--pyruvate transaminase